MCSESDDYLININGGAFEGPCFKYTLQNGDSIESIARRYKADIDIIMEVNPRLKDEPITNFKRILIPYTG